MHTDIDMKDWVVVSVRLMPLANSACCTAPVRHNSRRMRVSRASYQFSDEHYQRLHICNIMQSEQRFNNYHDAAYQL